MKRIILLTLLIIFIFTSCKSSLNNLNKGDFRIKNYSQKEIEFVWIAIEGEFYPTAKSITVKTNQIYEVLGLSNGIYDIAIDFKGEFNSYNSKKDKSLCLIIEKGITTIWKVNPDGNIIRN